MFDDLRTIVTRSRFALIQDGIGILAIGVMMTVALHLPALI